MGDNFPDGTGAEFLDEHDSFVNTLYESGESTMFVAGAALFMVGTVAAQLIVFSAFSVVSMAFAALPVIALWLIYSQSKNRDNPSRIITAMKLMKVYTIIQMVLFCMAIGGIGIAMLAGVALLSEAAGLGAVLFVMFLAFAAIFGVILYFFHIGLLRIIKNIREGVTQNRFSAIEPLRGVTGFTVVAGIIAAVSVLGAFAMLSNPGIFEEAIREILGEMPYYLEELFEGLAVQTRLSGFLSLIINIGNICLLVALNGFNGKLKSRG